MMYRFFFALTLAIAAPLALAWAQTTCVGQPKTQAQLLAEWQTCSAQGLQPGCLTPARVQDIICAIPLAPSGSVLAINRALTGTIPATGIPGDISSPVGSIVITSDASQPQIGLTSALSLVYQYGNAQTCTTDQCTRVGLWSELLKTQSTPGVSFDAGVFSNVVVKAPANGVKYQQMYAYAGQIEDSGGNYGGIVGGEIDIALHKNNDAIKEGWAVGSVPLASGNDQFQGDGTSDGYGLWAGGTCGTGSLAGGSGCAGFLTGFQFGRFDSYWPIADVGSVIQAIAGVGDVNKMKAQHGIDLHLITFSGYDIYFPGFSLTNNPSVMGWVGAPPRPGQVTYVNVNGNLPAFGLTDNTATPTTGGLVRLIGNTGSWLFEFNTAAGADFSTAFTPLQLNQTLSGVNLPNASTGTPAASLCLDAANNIIKKTTSGACI